MSTSQRNKSYLGMELSTINENSRANWGDNLTGKLRTFIRDDPAFRQFLHYNKCTITKLENFNLTNLYSQIECEGMENKVFGAGGFPLRPFIDRKIRSKIAYEYNKIWTTSRTSFQVTPSPSRSFSPPPHKHKKASQSPSVKINIFNNNPDEKPRPTTITRAESSSSEDSTSDIAVFDIGGVEILESQIASLPAREQAQIRRAMANVTSCRKRFDDLRDTGLGESEVDMFQVRREREKLAKSGKRVKDLNTEKGLAEKLDGVSL